MGSSGLFRVVQLLINNMRSSAVAVAMLFVGQAGATKAPSPVVNIIADAPTAGHMYAFEAPSELGRGRNDVSQFIGSADVRSVVKQQASGMLHVDLRAPHQSLHDVDASLGAILQAESAKRRSEEHRFSLLKTKMLDAEKTIVSTIVKSAMKPLLARYGL